MAKKSVKSKGTKTVKAASEKQTKGGKNAKKPAQPCPSSSEMVLEAIATLNEKKGSSLQAIKKYIYSTYLVNMAKQSFYIKKSLKKAVENKEIVQTKGKGASGRFRLYTKADARKDKQNNASTNKPAAVESTGASIKTKTGKKSVKKTKEQKPKSVVDKKRRQTNLNGLKIPKSLVIPSNKKNSKN